jgi:hypothetical protein
MDYILKIFSGVNKKTVPVVPIVQNVSAVHPETK